MKELGKQNMCSACCAPLLKPTRALVPPAFGVDISPIIWIAIASLIRELLLGQYGILIMMQTRG